MNAWKKYTPFLGENPNAENYVATQSLQNVINAMKTLPRLKGVNDITRPRRQELIGKYFVSQQNYNANVNQRADVLSQQQVRAAQQEVNILRQEVSNLQSQDAQSQQIINVLKQNVEQLVQQIYELNDEKENNEETVKNLRNQITSLNDTITELKSDKSVNQTTIANLQKTIASLNGKLGNKQKEMNKLQRKSGINQNVPKPVPIQ